MFEIAFLAFVNQIRRLGINVSQRRIHSSQYNQYASTGPNKQ